MKDIKKLIERNEATQLPIKEKYEPKNIIENLKEFPINKIMKHVYL